MKRFNSFRRCHTAMDTHVDHLMSGESGSNAAFWVNKIHDEVSDSEVLQVEEFIIYREFPLDPEGRELNLGLVR